MLLMFVNFFIDIANIIVSWIPLLCYLGAIVFFILGALAMSRLGNLGNGSRGDVYRAVIFFTITALLVSFVAMVNGLNETFGLPARVGLGDGLFAYQDAAPAFDPAAPQDWVIAMIGLFMPFFEAYGAASILRAMFLLKDSTREGINVTARVSAFAIAGVLLMNLQFLVGLFFGAGGGA